MTAELIQFDDFRSPSGSTDIAFQERALPPATVAIISQPSPSVMSSGPQKRRPWQLTCEARVKPQIEPLMGWTTSADPLTQVKLFFPTLAAAVAYAHRQRLNWRLRGAPEGAAVIMSVPPAWHRTEAAPLRLAA